MPKPKINVPKKMVKKSPKKPTILLRPKLPLLSEVETVITPLQRGDAVMLTWHPYYGVVGKVVRAVIGDNGQWQGIFYLIETEKNFISGVTINDLRKI